MRSKNWAIATLLLVTTLLLTQAIVPSTALGDGSWTNTGGGVSSYAICSLAYDSVHNTLYAGCEDSYGVDSAKGVWKYNGTSWTSTGGAVSSYHVIGLAYDSVHNLLYAGCSDAGRDKGVWKYNGTSWISTGGGMSSYMVECLAYDSTHNRLYAGTSSNGVWKYNGTSWSSTGGAVSRYQIGTLAYDQVHNLLYAGCMDLTTGAGYGVWKYNGTTWTNTGGGVSSYQIRSLAYDSGHNLLYAGTYGQGVWKYNGTSWTNTGGGVSSYHFISLAYDSGHNILYAGTGGYGMPGLGVWKYDGASWTNTGGGVASYQICSLTYDSTHNALYAGCEDNSTGTYKGVWKYSVGGSVAPPNFNSYVVLQNPNAHTANVTLTYMMDGGGTHKESITVGPTSRKTLYLNDSVGAGKTFSTMVSSSIPIIAERPMYFNYQGTWTGGHDVVGATAASSTFYFAEGTCRPNFDPYICIQNPGSATAKVTLTYMKGDGTSASDQVTVPKNSRVTVSPRNKLGTGDDRSHDFSTKVACTNGQKIIAERPMYFNYQGTWTGGHDVVGATAASSTFYFAEGTCRPNFDPYICIQNPGSATAKVTLTYMKGDGTSASDQVTVPKNSRVTVSPRNKLGTGDDPSHDFSTKVACTNGQTIIAERPMYFNYQGYTQLNWTGGHDVVGATAASSTFYFAEGTCRPNFDPYICIQNPGGKDAAVALTYMKGDGTTNTQTITVGKNSRSTVVVRDKLGTGDDPSHDFSTKVTCTNSQKIIAERPMYFNYQGYTQLNWTGGHDVVGALAASATWYFAEGYTGN